MEEPDIEAPAPAPKDDSPKYRDVVVEDISEGTKREKEAKKKLDKAVTATIASLGVTALALIMWLLERFVV